MLLILGIHLEAVAIARVWHLCDRRRSAVRLYAGDARSRSAGHCGAGGAVWTMCHQETRVS